MTDWRDTCTQKGGFDVRNIAVFFLKGSNQLIVNCWFGLMVWIPGIPILKGLLLGCIPRIPNQQPLVEPRWIR